MPNHPEPLRVFRPSSARRVGFSLTELLVATALAASLMVALAAGARMFSEQAAEVRDQVDVDFETSVNELLDDVRRGWTIERPSASRLELTDSYGGVTSYLLEDGSLKVARPDGATGELLAGVDSLSFDIDTIRRLRDATPVAVTGSWFASEAGGPGLPYLFGSATTAANAHDDYEPGLLTSDQALAIGFNVLSKAPDAVSTVPGVQEQVLSTTVTGLSLPISFTGHDPLLANPAVPPGKSELCHIPGGDPGKAHKIQVGSGAVTAHLAHGDYLGNCISSGVPPSGTLSIQIYEARVIGDARPYGPLLGEATLPVGLLPPAGYALVGGTKNVAGVYVTPPTGMLVSQPHASVPIDLTAIGITIESGKAYSLVIYYAGDGMVALRTDPSSSGSSAQPSLGGGYSNAGIAVQVSLSGTRMCTQTVEHEVIHRVGLTAVLGDGRSMSASAAVDGQLAAPNPWYGPVPGELPTLETYGQ